MEAGPRLCADCKEHFVGSTDSNMCCLCKESFCLKCTLSVFPGKKSCEAFAKETLRKDKKYTPLFLKVAALECCPTRGYHLGCQMCQFTKKRIARDSDQEVVLVADGKRIRSSSDSENEESDKKCRAEIEVV